MSDFKIIFVLKKQCQVIKNIRIIEIVFAVLKSPKSFLIFEPRPDPLEQQIGAKNLWLPDLFVTNTADSNGFISITDNNLAFVSSDGLVYLTLSLIGNYYNHTLW